MMAVRDQELEKLAKESFPELFGNMNAKIIKSEFSAQHFGNGILVINLGTMLLRLVRDRGMIAVELAPCGADRWDWFNAERVIQIICGFPFGFPLSPDGVRGVGRVLYENLPEITNAFAAEQWPTTKARLQKIISENLSGPQVR